MTEELFYKASKLRQELGKSKNQLKALKDLKGYAPTRTLRVIIPNYFNEGVDVPNELVECFLHMIDLHYSNQIITLDSEFKSLTTEL